MCTDARIQAYAIYDGLGVQSFHFGVGIQFVKVAHTQGKISVGKEFYGLSLLHAHEDGGNVLFDGTFLQ